MVDLLDSSLSQSDHQALGHISFPQSGWQLVLRCCGSSKLRIMEATELWGSFRAAELSPPDPPYSPMAEL